MSYKDTVRQYYEAIWNQNDRQLIPELLHQDIKFRGSLGQMQYGHADFENYLDFIRHALGDYHCEIIDMVAEENKVYARMSYTGIHHGDLFGFAPTYAKLKWEGIASFIFIDDKIAELWVIGDVQAVLKQLAKHVGE